MFAFIWAKIKGIFQNRLAYLILAVIILFSILVIRMYQLQIIEGDSSAAVQSSSSSSYKSYKLRYNDSTRGNIYDRNGNLLAYNVQSFNIVMGNSGLISSNFVKNSMISHLIKIIEKNGYQIETEFPIYIDEEGELQFSVSGNTLLRFKKNAYGLQSVNNLSDEQKEATAQEVFDFMRYGNATSAMFGISDDYPLPEALKIMNIRYQLFTLYPQYSQFTVCTDVDDKTMAAILENSDELLGVEIKQVTSRVYNDSVYFAHILGYTGKMNESEVESSNKELEEDIYNSSDVIGKTGIEKEMDKALRGEKGIERLELNSSGKVLDIEVLSTPVAGDDIYLSVDRELQIACYHILENNIASILISKLVDSMDYGGKGTTANKITVPIYEVYNAFFENGILDTDHFTEEDATELEKKVYGIFSNKVDSVTKNLRAVLAYDYPVVNKNLSEETNDFIDYVYSMLRSNGVLLKSEIDNSDQMYIKYQNDDISLSEFLRYSIDMQWVDLSLIGIGSEYYTNEEAYSKIMDYIFSELSTDVDFAKMIYKILIFGYKLSGRDVCLLLYDQDVIDYNENDYNKLRNGSISPYNFVIEKLTSLEIKPSMLALEPCSGSIVITDVNTGAVLAMVTYPSYDNNKLANKIDWEYYQTLLENQSLPLLNRPTQQLTATGSTFKPLMALAAFAEKLITPYSKIEDLGIFEKVDPSPKCWKYPKNHGLIDVSQAIEYSCNYFFFELGYEMSIISDDVDPSDSLGISKIQKYASMFGLSAKSGVEVPEAMPAISSIDSVRTSIGYYHSFSPVQISRYATALANRGTVYNLTLVDKITDKEKNVVVNNSASVYNQIDIYSEEEWNAIYKGMYNVIYGSSSDLRSLYRDMDLRVAGKTGTAQVSLTHPSHVLYISFAPYDDPDISVTVVLPNGYSSYNPAKVGREVYGLYYYDENKEELLSGDYTLTEATDILISD